MTVREHYRKFGDIELLELLYDDLKTWNTWVLEKRSLQPVGLISVGSDPVNTASASHPVPHTQCAQQFSVRACSFLGLHCVAM